MAEKIESTRREFLKKSALAGIVATGGLALGIGANKSQAQAVPVPDKWDNEYDVIVVGSGFAGLAAAITAKESGAKSVVILEKMPVAGGNSIINGGLLAVVNSGLQKKEGIEDSVELYLNDLLKAGRGINHVKLIKIVAEQGQDLPEWCSKRGVEWNSKLEHLGGHSVARTYLTTNSSGSGIVKPLIKYYKEQLGGVLKTKTKLIGIIREVSASGEDGSVLGVQVSEGYKFNYKATDGDRNNSSGTKKSYRARKGIVIASGGFSQDPFYRGAQDPNLAKPTDQLDSTNHPGATAEAIEELFRLGAVPVHLSWIQSGPWASPNEKGFGVGSSYQIAAGFRFGIMIDKKTGKRFVNELADRRTRALAMFKVIGDPNKPSYPFSIADSQDGVLAAQTLKKCLERKVVLKFDTLDEVAAHYGVPADGLKQQIAEYNGYVKSGRDEQFDKPINTKVMKPIEKAPFLVMEGVPKTHHTMGGIMIDTEGCVIEATTQKPVPGLYAAGEVVGGPHGASRLGSCAIPDCLVFGRICGKKVMM